MTWTTPSTYASGQTMTAALLNQQLRDNVTVANRDPLVFAFPGTLSTGSQVGQFIAPFPFVVNTLRASVGVASTSTSEIVFDVNRIPAGGSTAVTILSTAGLSITTGAKHGTAIAPLSSTFAAGDIMTFDVVADGGANAQHATISASVSGR